MIAGIKKLSPVEIKEMVRLREVEGISFPLLAELFGRDHSTVMYHCRKAGVERKHALITSYTLGIRTKRRIQREIKEEVTRGKMIVVRHQSTTRVYGSRPDNVRKLSCYEEIVIKQIKKKFHLTPLDEQKEIDNFLKSYRSRSGASFYV